MYNLTPQDIVDDMIGNFKASVEGQVKDIIERLDKGEKAYHQFTITYEEAMRQTKNRASKKEYKVIFEDTQKKVK